MPRYLCLYVDISNKVVDSEPITSPSTPAAIERAIGLLSTMTSTVGIEVWKNGVLKKKLWRLPENQRQAEMNTSMAVPELIDASLLPSHAIGPEHHSQRSR